MLLDNAFIWQQYKDITRILSKYENEMRWWSFVLNNETGMNDKKTKPWINDNGKIKSIIKL